MGRTAKGKPRRNQAPGDGRVSVRSLTSTCLSDLLRPVTSIGMWHWVCAGAWSTGCGATWEDEPPNPDRTATMRRTGSDCVWPWCSWDQQGITSEVSSLPFFSQWSSCREHMMNANKHKPRSEQVFVQLEGRPWKYWTKLDECFSRFLHTLPTENIWLLSLAVRVGVVPAAISIRQLLMDFTIKQHSLKAVQRCLGRQHSLGRKVEFLCCKRWMESTSFLHSWRETDTALLWLHLPCLWHSSRDTVLSWQRWQVLGNYKYMSDLWCQYLEAATWLQLENNRACSVLATF